MAMLRNNQLLQQYQEHVFVATATKVLLTSYNCSDKTENASEIMRCDL